MKRLALALSIGSISTSALAASWMPVGNAVLRKYFVDAKSISGGGIDPVRTWVKIDFRRDPTVKIDHALGVWEFRCQSHEVRITSRTNYARNGALMDTEEFRDAQFSGIVPGSIEQAIEAAVCARPKPAARR